MEDAWRLLRATRANRPWRAAAGDHAQNYVASLEQAEQLWHAAGEVGPASSPIVLYYSLSQALRAVLSAFGRAVPTKGGHGLQLDWGTLTAASPGLRDVSVVPKGRGLIQEVAVVLGSPVLKGPATLAELIYSLVDCLYVVAGAPRRSEDGEDYVPIRVLVTDPEDRWTKLDAPAIDSARASVGGVPAYLLAEPLAVQPVRDWLAHYPGLTGPDAPTDVAIVRDRKGGPHLSVRWPSDRQVDEIKAAVHAPTRPGLAFDPVYCVPAVGGNDRAQHPLVAWQAILFGMSMLARYQSRHWAAMLDADESRDAERVRHTLAIGREAVLELVLLEIERARHSEGC